MTELSDKVTLRDVYEIVTRLEGKMEQQYVTKAEYLPVKSIVYSAAALILVSVFGFLISTVIKS